ncbi:MAG: CBS domain-containing protein, partial [Anaerolineae bacterium]
SAFCIGSGGSAGREGPIVQVGAALGSTFGQWLRLSEDRIRNLVACGAAAGIAATFNAPIAGVLFAVEIILGELHMGMLGNVVISAVTASTVERVFLGERPAFNIPIYGIQTPWEVLLYVLLGILAAVTAVAFIHILYWFEDLFDGWHFPDALKPAVGGLLLGALALIYPPFLGRIGVPANETLAGLPITENIPHIFGAGFSVIEGALLGQLSLALLFLLIFLKPLATSFTLGSGNSGGVFAPSLFTGAALGGAFGQVVKVLFPGMTSGPGAFAVVGMAAVFAGAARAPFTAILIVFEMTDDYRLILPLMAAVVVSVLVAERLERESIYTLKLTRRGIRLQRGRDVDVMESVRVADVMITDRLTLSVDTPVTVLAQKFIETARHGFAVLDENGELYGIVSLSDYRAALEKYKDVSKLTVGDIASRAVVTAFPDETIGAVMRRMAPRDISRLPVVDRENPKKVIGLVRRNDIVRAYEIGVTNREKARLLASQKRLREASGLDTVELRVEKGSFCDGKRISEIPWPQDCIIATLRRGRRAVIPHGNAALRAGDILIAVGKPDALATARRLCTEEEKGTVETEQ